MRDIWAMQPRFEKRVGKTPYKLLENTRLRAGNTNFFKQTGKLKQISNGIFPDGSYGTEGFNKYIKFDSNLNDYVGTRELIQVITNLNH